jgi:hypothetical protein
MQYGILKMCAVCKKTNPKIWYAVKFSKRRLSTKAAATYAQKLTVENLLQGKVNVKAHFNVDSPTGRNIPAAFRRYLQKLKETGADKVMCAYYIRYACVRYVHMHVLIHIYLY